MPAKTTYLFVVSMDVLAEHEALFNEVYDTEHVPYLTGVPGVKAATRSITRPLRLMLGGEEQSIEMADEPRYSVTYEIESPEVLLSPEWAAAGERGRWATVVRPLTTNRRHVLREVLSTAGS